MVPINSKSIRALTCINNEFQPNFCNKLLTILWQTILDRLYMWYRLLDEWYDPLHPWKLSSKESKRRLSVTWGEKPSGLWIKLLIIRFSNAVNPPSSCMESLFPYQMKHKVLHVLWQWKFRVILNNLLVVAQSRFHFMFTWCHEAITMVLTKRPSVYGPVIGTRDLIEPSCNNKCHILPP